MALRIVLLLLLVDTVTGFGVVPWLSMRSPYPGIRACGHRHRSFATSSRSTVLRAAVPADGSSSQGVSDQKEGPGNWWRGPSNQDSREIVELLKMDRQAMESTLPTSATSFGRVFGCLLLLRRNSCHRVCCHWLTSMAEDFFRPWVAGDYVLAQGVHTAHETVQRPLQVTFWTPLVRSMLHRTSDICLCPATVHLPRTRAFRTPPQVKSSQRT